MACETHHDAKTNLLIADMEKRCMAVARIVRELCTICARVMRKWCKSFEQRLNVAADISMLRQTAINHDDVMPLLVAIVDIGLIKLR